MKSKLFVAITLGALALFGQTSRMAEGRYEMKYGRPMPGAQVRASAEPERQTCCRCGSSVAQGAIHARRVERSAARVQESAARLQEKYGRVAATTKGGEECQEACCRHAE